MSALRPAIPPFTAALTVDAHSSDDTVASINSDSEGATIQEAWLTVGDVSFEEEINCAEPMGGVAATIGAADHAQTGHLTSMFTLTERSYCRVRVQFLLLAGALPFGAPPELSGASIVLVGQTASGTEFTLVSAAALTVPVEALADAVTLDAEEPGLFLGFDVATWFAGIDLDSATVGGDGRVLVDATENPALLTAFEANIAAGVELFPDDDRNGIPDGPPVARGAP